MSNLICNNAGKCFEILCNHKVEHKLTRRCNFVGCKLFEDSVCVECGQ